MKTNTSPATKPARTRFGRWLCLAVLASISLVQSASAEHMNLNWTYTPQQDGQLLVELTWRLAGARPNSNYVLMRSDGTRQSFRVGADGTGVCLTTKKVVSASSDWATQKNIQGAARFYNRADLIPLEVPYSFTVTNPLNKQAAPDSAGSRMMNENITIENKLNELFKELLPLYEPDPSETARDNDARMKELGKRINDLLKTAPETEELVNQVAEMREREAKYAQNRAKYPATSFMNDRPIIVKEMPIDIAGGWTYDQGAIHVEISVSQKGPKFSGGDSTGANFTAEFSDSSHFKLKYVADGTYKKNSTKEYDGEVSTDGRSLTLRDGQESWTWYKKSSAS